jgi:hypothetical protein
MSTVGCQYFVLSSNLESQIRDAVAKYERKYGKPTLCLVPVSSPKPFPMFEGLVIRPSKSVPVSHVWIGTEEIDPAIAKSLARLST